LIINGIRACANLDPGDRFPDRLNWSKFDRAIKVKALLQELADAKNSYGPGK
jgi:hypothetical protein